MTAWVALLRGVNVGGITIRNADLAALMTDDLGFADVRTILASGNVTFEADAAPSARARLKQSIEAALRDRFGYDAWIVLVTRTEVEKAIAAFPFDATIDSRQPWVIFGSDEAVLDELEDAAASFDAEGGSDFTRPRSHLLEPGEGHDSRHRVRQAAVAEGVPLLDHEPQSAHAAEDRRRVTRRPAA